MWVAGGIVTLLVIEVFFLPEQYREISDEWAWSWALAFIALAVILLLPAFKILDTIKGKRWSVGLPLISAFLLVLLLTQTIPSHHPYIFLGILGVALWFFNWFSKELRPLDAVDAHQSERSDENVE